jgi:dihydrofolate reductase
MVTIIVAIAHNNVIGKQNGLPWYLPEDLKRFKERTTGHVVVMGRKTYDSIIARLGHPLPNRTSVVVTRQTDFAAPAGVEVVHSLNEALTRHTNDEVFIAGGGQIYAEALPLTDQLDVTHVDQAIDGDTFFPPIDPAVWKKTHEDPQAGFTWTTYERI